MPASRRARLLFKAGTSAGRGSASPRDPEVPARSGQYAALGTSEHLIALATVERALGKFDDALVHARQAALVDPRSVNGARRVATAYHDLRRYAEEQAAWNRALALAPNNLVIIQAKATGYLSLGKLDSVHALVHEKPIFVQSGQHERALDLIEPLLSVAGSDLTPGYLELDPTFKPLAGNPRFQRLIGQR